MNWSIKLSPCAALPGDTGALTLSVQGSVATICGDALDLSGLLDGDTLDASANPYLVAGVHRSGDTFHMALRLPHGPVASPETLFPVPLLVTVDGNINLPPYAAEE